MFVFGPYLKSVLVSLDITVGFDWAFSTLTQQRHVKLARMSLDCAEIRRSSCFQELSEFKLQIHFLSSTKIDVWMMISLPVLACESSLGASADASVCPLTCTTRELAPRPNTDVFLSWAQRKEPDVISVEQHGIAGTLAYVLESLREDRLTLKASAWHRDGPLMLPVRWGTHRPCRRPICWTCSLPSKK